MREEKIVDDTRRRDIVLREDAIELGRLWLSGLCKF